MPRRFTDTEKWRDEWWGSLSNDYRMIWLYLVDSCSIAGIWKKDFRGMNFNCNTNIDEKTFWDVFGSRLIDRGGYYFIPKFLRYQCPKGLNSNKPAIISIVKELQQNNLTQIVNESLGNGFLTIKDKGKGKGKDKGEGKEEGKYITIAGAKIYDILPVLEIREAALNGSQKEQGWKDWRTMIDPWLNENLECAFNDDMHVYNSFKKYMMKNGKAKGVNGTHTPKLTLKELES